MKKIVFLFVSILFLLGGCYPYQYSTYNATPKTTAVHIYEVMVADIDGNPLEGVKVYSDLYANYELVSRDTLITYPEGFFIGTAKTPKTRYGSSYSSKIKYSLSKEGYYNKSGEISSFEFSSDTLKKVETVTLIKPIDYFNKEFVSSLTDVELKNRILKFIDLILLEGFLTESVLETLSINLITFKNNDYLQFKFKNGVVYNTLQLDKYDVGKRIFDEVIRKILSPLNEYISETELFYGYDIAVEGYTKKFTDEYATPTAIEYKFMIPQEIVKQYKNQDISGQNVLDSSIILMDNERIELKLQ